MSGPRLTVPDVLPRVKAYVNQPGNGVGGRLHIILDDGNVQDHDVQWCIDNALEVGDVEAAEIGRLLLSMTKTQRLKIAGGC